MFNIALKWIFFLQTPQLYFFLMVVIIVEKIIKINIFQLKPLKNFFLAQSYGIRE